MVVPAAAVPELPCRCPGLCINMGACTICLCLGFCQSDVYCRHAWCRDLGSRGPPFWPWRTAARSRLVDEWHSFRRWPLQGSGWRRFGRWPLHCGPRWRRLWRRLCLRRPRPRKVAAARLNHVFHGGDLRGSRRCAPGGTPLTRVGIQPQHTRIWRRHEGRGTTGLPHSFLGLSPYLID